MDEREKGREGLEEEWAYFKDYVKFEISMWSKKVGTESEELRGLIRWKREVYGHLLQNRSENNREEFSTKEKLISSED